MKYACVCSGAKAFGKDWEAMGFQSVFHSEIEPNASALLKHHYPDTPNHGDFTTIDTNGYTGLIQLLAGGTPCQSFSIAGLRGGMEDSRGNLTLGFCKLAAQLMPRWILWENVPGVLSSNGGRDFGSFLGGLANIGYGFAYRVLDAQYFGVPQRRKRVFVVGCLGDWRSAAAVLFERHSLQGHPTPRREKGEGATGRTETSPIAYRWQNESSGIVEDMVSATVRRESATTDERSVPAYVVPINTQMALRGADTSNSSREGIGIGEEGDPGFTLQANHGHAVAVAFKVRGGCEGGGKGYLGNEDTAFTVATGSDQQLYHRQAVRQLTPKECERLQGWEDDWTRYGINAKGKPYELSDSARYRIIGNGWARPVANWIADRIMRVDKMITA